VQYLRAGFNVFGSTSRNFQVEECRYPLLAESKAWDGKAALLKPHMEPLALGQLKPASGREL